MKQASHRTLRHIRRFWGFALCRRVDVTTNRILALLLLSLLPYGCTSLPSREEARLVPPAGSTPETRRAEIAECVARAQEAYQHGEPVSDAQRARLQGRSTVKFFREGRAVVDGQHIPRMWNSPLVPLHGYVQKGISDRYIIYLLERGYQWPDTGNANQATTLPTR